MIRSAVRDVSNLLRSWRGGDDAALDGLIPRVHDELHHLAHLYIRRERACHILKTTALLDEAYIRLVDAREVDWQDPDASNLDIWLMDWGGPLPLPAFLTGAPC